MLTVHGQQYLFSTPIKPGSRLWAGVSTIVYMSNCIPNISVNVIIYPCPELNCAPTVSKVGPCFISLYLHPSDFLSPLQRRHVSIRASPAINSWTTCPDWRRITHQSSALLNRWLSHKGSVLHKVFSGHGGIMILHKAQRNTCLVDHIIINSPFVLKCLLCIFM